MPSTSSPTPQRRIAAVLVGIVVVAAVYALTDLGFSRAALARFPDPTQALVWVRIGHFVAAILAAAVGMLVWHRVRRPR